MALFDRKNLRDKSELIIGISNWCNYDCTYCMPHSKARTRRLDDVEPLISLIYKSYDHFKQHANTKYSGVMFVGGEPTIHADFNTIIDRIQPLREDPDYRITIVTNFSRTKKWWVKIAPKVTGLLTSYHDEFTNVEEFSDKIVAVMQTNPDMFVTVGLQPVPGNLTHIHDKALAMRKIITEAIGPAHAHDKLDFLVQHLYTGVDELFPYSDGELEQFKSMMADLNNTNIHISDQMSSQDEFVEHSFSMGDEYMGSECYAGVESITVAFDGRISRTARCGLRKDLRILGNLYTEYTLPTEPAICDVPKGCGNCWFDYAVRKRTPSTQNG